MKINYSFLITSVLIMIGLAITFFKLNPDILNRKSTNYFPSDFNKFCINDICLEKENDVWMVSQNNEKVPADKEMVEIYSQKFKDIIFGDLVSQNQSKFSELGIGGNNKVILEINNKKLEIGNISSDTDGTYVREDNGSYVYKINTILEKNNLSNPKYWYLRQKAE